MMQITINVPSKDEILRAGFTVGTAMTGENWSKSQLEDYADLKGVYIHHSNGHILYVGKTTDGKYGTFGERLRREFQERASGNSRLHQHLRSQSTPIRTHCLALKDLDKMFSSGPIQLSQVGKALIMEQILIDAYSLGQRNADASAASS